MTDRRDDSKNILPPPTMRIGVLRWLKENLFSSVLNSLLTILAAILIIWFLVPTVNWAVLDATWSGGPEACTEAQQEAIATETERGACWAVIPYNMKRLMSGSYPVDQTFRIWLSLIIFVGLFGLGTGMFGGLWRMAAAVVGGASVLVLLFPFSAVTRGLIIVIPIALLFTVVIGHLLRHSKIARRSLIFLWLLSPIALGIILSGFSGSEILPEISTRQWGGLFLNFIIAVVGITASFPLGVLLALGRRSKLVVVRTVCVLYIETIRGMPLIAIIVIALIMLRLFLPGTWDVDDLIRVMVAFTLFTAAYIAENVRGGLQSIPKGQEEAAHALGLSAIYTMTFIVMPQALRAVIPANVGQFISLLKDTSLVFFAALLDVLSIGLSILNEPQWPGPNKEMLIFVALSFWIFAYFMSYMSRKLEKSLGVGER